MAPLDRASLLNNTISPQGATLLHSAEQNHIKITYDIFPRHVESLSTPPIPSRLLMSSRYRPLLPNPTPASSSTEDASGSQSQSSLSSLIKIPRAGTRTACESCRKKKIRRIGGRPMCKRCIETTTDCIYRTDEEEKSILALEGHNSELMTELEQLRELYSMIHSRSTEEAQEIFNRIRTNSDPIEVLQMVKASELLLQGTLAEETGMEVQARRE